MKGLLFPLSLLLSAHAEVQEGTPFHYIDTSGWVGSEYTPARAVNSLWLAKLEDYREDIKTELAAVTRHLGFTVLRVFLHSLVYEALGEEQFIQNVHEFLEIASANSLRVGFVICEYEFTPCPSTPEASPSLQIPIKLGILGTTVEICPEMGMSGPMYRAPGATESVVPQS